MMRSFLIVTIFFLMQACSNKDKLPQGVLPKEKMREIMWDMIRAAAFLESYVVSKDSTINKAAENQKWYNKIYEIHKTSKAAFEKSYTYYKAHPLVMKEMLDTLARRQISTSSSTHRLSAKDSTGFKKDTIHLRDSMRRPFDSLMRKRLIKKPKPAPAV